jgi:hypothetical protein
MSISVLVNSHSDARSLAEAEGKITHSTLNDIAQQLFQVVVTEASYAAASDSHQMEN